MLDWLRTLWRRSRRSHALGELARASGEPFRVSAYFSLAERDIDDQWARIIWPWIGHLDLTHVLDLAAGHGRNSEKLAVHAERLTLVDINEESLAACRARFGDDERFRYVRTDGHSLRGIADGSVTLVYCFDAMVHFAPEVVEAYLPELVRVLVPGGHAFLHHSNHAGAPGSDFRDAPHWRNRMTLERMAELARRAGLEVERAEPLDWGRGDERCPGLDGLTLLRRP